MSHINPQTAKTLSGLFQQRVCLTPHKPAYQYYQKDAWHSFTWQEIADKASRWQEALRKEGLQKGERVAIMMQNSPDWVSFDQAALGLGLVVVPLFYNDRVDNAAYILDHTQTRVLITDNPQIAQALRIKHAELPSLQLIVCLGKQAELIHTHPTQENVGLQCMTAQQWCPQESTEAFLFNTEDSHALATIVYTSGTTGRPKGVMLSHWNILTNADACLQFTAIDEASTFLSFLPLSHMFERVGGYYLPVMSGSHVTYTRSILDLAEDLQTIKPSVLISVPRIYERIFVKIREELSKKSKVAQKLFEWAVQIGNQQFEYQHGRQAWQYQFIFMPLLHRLVSQKVLNRFGGRVQYAICGGAPLSQPVADLFTGLGLPILQGYGMTECSPVAITNRPDSNIPVSIGVPIPGATIRIAEHDELQVQSESVMLGYWRNEEATKSTVTEDGWLRTGDKARFDQHSGHYYIIGRLKEILVLATGEKVPPHDIEAAIITDPLFEHALVLGEGMPYLSAIVSLNQEHWDTLVSEENFSTPDDSKTHKHLKKRCQNLLQHFPGYARIHRIHFCQEAWEVENDMLTPTLKLKRNNIMQHYQKAIDHLYQGHRI